MHCCSCVHILLFLSRSILLLQFVLPVSRRFRFKCKWIYHGRQKEVRRFFIPSHVRNGFLSSASSWQPTCRLSRMWLLLISRRQQQRRTNHSDGIFNLRTNGTAGEVNGEWLKRTNGKSMNKQRNCRQWKSNDVRREILFCHASRRRHTIETVRWTAIEMDEREMATGITLGCRRKFNGNLCNIFPRRTFDFVQIFHYRFALFCRIENCFFFFLLSFLCYGECRPKCGNATESPRGYIERWFGWERTSFYDRIPASAQVFIGKVFVPRTQVVTLPHRRGASTSPLMDGSKSRERKRAGKKWGKSVGNFFNCVHTYIWKKVLGERFSVAMAHTYKQGFGPLRVAGNKILNAKKNTFILCC